MLFRSLCVQGWNSGSGVILTSAGRLELPKGIYEAICLSVESKLRCFGMGDGMGGQSAVNGLPLVQTGIVML